MKYLEILKGFTVISCKENRSEMQVFLKLTMQLRVTESYFICVTLVLEPGQGHISGGIAILSDNFSTMKFLFENIIQMLKPLHWMSQ